jgi:hypothetical protein
MYLHSKNIHPSVLNEMKCQKPVTKIARQFTRNGMALMESTHLDGRKIVVEKKADAILGDLVVAVNEDQMFVLNEHDQYELINEGIWRDAVSGFRYLYGAFKTKLKKIFGNETETEKFLDAYKKNPQAARDHLQKRLEGQGKTKEEAAAQVKSFITAQDKAEALKKGIKVRDVQTARALHGIDKAVKAGAGDQNSIKTGIQRVMSDHAGVFSGGGSSEPKQSKPQQQQQPKPQQQQSQQQQPAAKPAPQPAQPPAKKVTFDKKFEEGDEVTATDPKTNQVHTGKVAIVDDKGNYVINTGKPSADGKSTISLPASQYEWAKVDPNAQPAQQQPAQPPAQQQPAAQQPAAQQAAEPAPQPAKPPAPEVKPVPPQQDSAQGGEETGGPAVPQPPQPKPQPQPQQQQTRPQKQPMKKSRSQYPYKDHIGDSVEDGRKTIEKKTKKGSLLEVFENINSPKGKQT